MITIPNLGSRDTHTFVLLTMINFYGWTMKISNIEDIIFAGYLQVFFTPKGDIFLTVIRGYDLFCQDQFSPDMSSIKAARKLGREFCPHVLAIYSVVTSQPRL